jgi:release factor glutamine methyltransferase
MSTATAAPVVWTIRELLSWTTNYLSQKGIDSPRLDAQVLLAHVLKVPRIELIARSTDEPTAAERTAFRELVRRRVEGWPVAYLTGTKEFYLLSFRVSPAVLIPRPDTETLVLEAVSRAKAKPAARVLELGTGSGCIAVAIASGAPQAKVTAVDLSPDAAELARANASQLGVGERVRVVVGDLFSPVQNEAPFDLIVSNPPYIATAEIETLSADVKDHEPRLALDGGPDGLNFYRRIATAAGDRLAPGGTLLLEFGDGQAPAVTDLLTRAGWTATTKKDAAGRMRVAIATR